MKQLKNFLIKREQSQACLSFAKREKSRLLAKTILTLVLLMTVATGAWAQGYYDININFNPVYSPEFTVFMCDVMGPDMPSGTLNLSVDGVSKGSFRVDNGMCSSEIHSLDAGDHTWYAEFTPDGSSEKSTESRSFTIDQDFAYVYINDPEQSSIEMGVGESRNFWGHVDGPESSEVNISSSNENVAKFRASSSFSYGFEGYIDAVGAGTATITVSFAGNKNYKAAQSKTLTVTVLAPAATVEVAWTAASKTGTFKMPGGNVELEPEYFAVAEFTDGGAPTGIADIKATTDDDIVKAGTVKNIGSSTTPQGTVMYYAVQSATAPTAPDYDATGWTDKVPTANGLQEGNVYVWYYIKGAEPAQGTDRTDDNTRSDSDIKALGTTGFVTLLPAPTYAVTFADDTAEPTLWTASPNADVTKGQTVTVTYTGTKKVLGVKAEKKAAAAGIVNPVVGQIIGSDGKNYDANATLPDGVTKVAMIAYVGSETGVDGYTHGLALALTDEGQMAWEAAMTACNTTKNTNTPVTGATWLLPSYDQWKKMIDAAGGSTALRDGFSGISGASNLQSEKYWSSTEYTAAANSARVILFSYGMWGYTDKGEGNTLVRACLAF
jgi:hypothetical protein